MYHVMPQNYVAVATHLAKFSLHPLSHVSFESTTQIFFLDGPTPRPRRRLLPMVTLALLTCVGVIESNVYGSLC